jgi:DNA-binding NtrC family response regulator
MNRNSASVECVNNVMTSAATRPNVSARGLDTVLIVDEQVLVRSLLAEYLRGCGYRVLEARNVDEAVVALQRPLEPIHIVFTNAEHGFALSHWIRKRRPEIRIIISGTIERAAQAAAELCDNGPQAARPYDPQLLVQQIKSDVAKGEG